ncbi:MAG TPA: hypothetical protein VGK37_15580 [Casimicrobiaceae bacterium]|jgi:hypothetical protein
MTRPLKQWKVLPHGRLVDVDMSIRTVVGEIPMPLTKFPRRMTVVRLRDSRLVVFSAIALDETEMQGLESFGRPAFLVVPSDKHRLDAGIWKARYPALQVIAPKGARAAVEKIVHVDATELDCDDPAVQFVTVPGTRDREAALVVRTSNGVTLVLNDIVGNIPDMPGFAGWFLRRAGFVGSKPQIPKVVKLVMIHDQAALRAQLLRWAGIESLKRILVSHGASIEDHPREILRELAGSLA